MRLPGWEVALPEVALPPGWSWREDPHHLFLCRGQGVVATYSGEIRREDLFRSVLEEVARRAGLPVAAALPEGPG